MRFDKALPIVYPFTTYYYGYLSDLGENPVITVNLFNHAAHSVVEVDSMVDIKEIRQVSNDTLIVGTAYINREGNDLTPGDYRLLLTLQMPYTQVDLLYAPIEIADLNSSFRVSFVNRKNITDDEIRDYIKDIVPSGVKNGFNITFGQETNSLNIGAGVLYSDKGTKIVLDTTMKMPFYIDPTNDSARTDIICVHYDEKLYDRDGNVLAPDLRIIKGVNFTGTNIPVLPDCYVPIAYISIKANVKVINANNTRIIPIRYQINDRPFFNERALELGDGYRDEFSFNTFYIKDTTKVYVDGVRQYLGEDYEEVSSSIGYSSIRFTDGVPAEGQIVTMSGQTMISPYLDVDKTSYVTPYYPEDREYKQYDNAIQFFRSDAYDMASMTWRPDYVGSEFVAPSPLQRPIFSFSKELGRCVYFRDTDSLMSTEEDFVQKNRSYVILADFRDTPQDSTLRRRLLTFKDMFVDVIHAQLQTKFILAMNDTDILTLTVSSAKIREVPAVLALNVFDDKISLHYSINEFREITDSELIATLLSDDTSFLNIGKYADVPGLSCSILSLSVYEEPIGRNEYLYFAGIPRE